MRRNISRLIGVAVVAAVVSAGLAAAAPAGQTAKQRIAIDVKLPLSGGPGVFKLEVLTPGTFKPDSGSVTFIGPTPVFTGRIIRGQSVDRFRGTDSLKGKNGTLVINLQEDFTSAGHGYMVGTGTWSVARGTGAYAGLTGGGRSSLARPPSPPGKFGSARHEGFVTTG